MATLLANARVGAFCRVLHKRSSGSKRCEIISTNRDKAARICVVELARVIRAVDRSDGDSGRSRSPLPPITNAAAVKCAEAIPIAGCGLCVAARCESRVCLSPRRGWMKAKADGRPGNEPKAQ